MLTVMPWSRLSPLAQSSTTTSSGAGVLVLIYLVFLVLFIVGWVKIISKAGYSGWWVLLGLVPLVNVVMFLVFAFSEWPSQRELRSARSAMQTTAFRGPFQPPSAPPPPPPTPS